MRPGLDRIEPGHLVVLGAAFAFGISLVMVKSLTRTDNVVRIIFWMLIIQSAIGLAPALYFWRDPPAELWPWILLIAFTGASSHFCLAQALVHADATLISPIDFLRVPLSALIGWLLYHEQIDVYTAARRRPDPGRQPAQSADAAGPRTPRLSFPSRGAGGQDFRAIYARGAIALCRCRQNRARIGFPSIATGATHGDARIWRTPAASRTSPADCRPAST